MAKVSASPLDSLVDLACRDGVDIRPTLLRVLTDLYVQKPIHSVDEETQYVELALGLIDAVDAPTRAAVSATLSAYPSEPAAIRRKLLSYGVVPVASTAEAEPETTATHDLLELFFAAGAEERCMILINLDLTSEATERRLAPDAGDAVQRLENAALKRNAGEFSRILERALGINRVLAERIARDNSGEPLVVSARALGMPAAVLQRVLLFLNPAIGQSIGRVFDLARLFDELTPAAAERMVAIWRQAGGRTQVRHEAMLWDDERRDARAQSTSARHRALQPHDQRASRFKVGGR